MGVESRIINWKERLPLENLEGIILSGSPAFVDKAGAPSIDKKIFELKVPVLGICYGMQLMAKLLGGKVGEGRVKEYGQVEAVLKPSALFRGAVGKQKVLMSHGDQVLKLPPGFVNLGRSKNVSNIAMSRGTLWAVQFHPETTHTENGKKILKNFVLGICQAKKTLNQSQWLKHQVQLIKAETGKERVIGGLSGGVDSAAAAAIVYKAVGDRLRCVYVDTGLMRLGETEQVEQDFKKFFGKSLVVIKAEDKFLQALKGKIDPEEKRKIIGKLFIDIFEAEARKWGAKYLVQGTIYPDVIESAKGDGIAQTIKSHHNVGGLPEKMKLKLIEPLRDLYKDEVKKIAKQIGLPEKIINRQPFPGPGLAIRIRGEVTRERLERLRQAEAILQAEAKKFTLPKDLWVNQAIYVPLLTTGVKGDERVFEEMIAIRSLTSTDVMTADWTRLPYELLARVSSRIVNEVKGINRVVYDITTKPPATMEWE